MCPLMVLSIAISCLWISYRVSSFILIKVINFWTPFHPQIVVHVRGRKIENECEIKSGVKFMVRESEALLIILFMKGRKLSSCVVLKNFRLKNCWNYWSICEKAWKFGKIIIHENVSKRKVMSTEKIKSSSYQAN